MTDQITLVGGDDGLMPMAADDPILLTLSDAGYGHLVIQDGEHLGVVPLIGCGCEDDGVLDLTIIGALYRGESLYEMAVRLGFTGTEQQFLLSLVGPESPNAAEATAQADRAEAEADRAAIEADRAETAASLSETHAEAASDSAASAAQYASDLDEQVSVASGYATSASSYSTSASAFATAAANHKIAAETAAAAAEVTLQNTVSVYEDTEISRAAAVTASNTAVTMRNQAEGFSQASAASRDTAQGYVDDVTSFAQAASQDSLLAAAYRDDANASALAAAEFKTQAESYASDSLASATASQTSRLAAETVFDGVSGTAAAAVESASLAETWADAAGTYAAASQSSSLSASASQQAAQDIVDGLAAINPTLNFLGTFDHEPTQVELGSEWKQNAFYKNSLNGYSYVLTGTPLEWERYLADGNLYQLTVESNNGTVFRVGQATHTTLKGRLFKNGAEITDVTPSSYFSWRRVSSDSVADGVWNALYSAGYKQVTISVDDVYAKASFFCDISSPT
jgi:hypothetical protein